MTKTSWTSRTNDGLRAQGTKTRAYLDSKFGDFGIEGTSAAWINNRFKPALDVYSDAVIDWLDKTHRTPLKITTLQTAKKEFLPLYRELYAFLKGNPMVTDTDLQAMGFPKRPSGKRSSISQPETVPEAAVELPSEGVVKISFRDKGSDKKGKPAGVHGVEIRWCVGDVAIQRKEELTESAFNTASPYTFSFPDSQRGKILCFALRWENTKGEKGNLSPIYRVIIP
jgi:hypothetical protein